MNNYRFSEDAVVTVVDFDPNASDTLTEVRNGSTLAWLDMSGYDRLTVLFLPTITYGIIQDANIVGSALATGASDTVITSLGSSTPTALGGYAILETSADEIAAVDEAIRYVSAKVSISTGTGELLVVFIRHGARYKQAGLSATSA